MIVASFDLAGTLTGIGTLLVGLATLAGVIDGRRKVRDVQDKVDEVHETVNGAAAAQVARVEQLTDAIHESGFAVPPRPSTDTPTP